MPALLTAATLKCAPLHDVVLRQRKPVDFLRAQVKLLGCMHVANECAAYSVWTLWLSVTLMIQSTLFDNKVKYQGIFF